MNDDTRLIAGAALLVAAVLLSGQDQPSPPPSPPPAIRLQFVGETASQDASLLSAYFSELADEIEWDGRQEKQMLVAGVHFDALRLRARLARVRGQSIGERQTAAREAIGDYLTQQLGVSGGPVDEPQRAKWVSCFRELARACDAAQ